MTDWLALAKVRENELFDLIEKLVLIESPTHDKTANDRIASLVAEMVRSLGAEVIIHPEPKYGDHVSATWGPGNNSDKQHAFIVGHLDTVWPVGTLARMGYRERVGRMYGPGVLDMKAGIATTIVGLLALQSNGLWPDRPITILFNTDEEVGSPSSRPLVESLARGADYALIMEPGHADAGALKTQRKGLGEFRISVEGKASHAGAFPERGASAIHELAQKVLELQAMNDWPNGITVNTGLISGGSARNTIPARAEATIDVRVRTTDQAAQLEAQIRSLKPVIEGTQNIQLPGVNAVKEFVNRYGHGVASRGAERISRRQMAAFSCPKWITCASNAGRFCWDTLSSPLPLPSPSPSLPRGANSHRPLSLSPAALTPPSR